MGGWRSGVVCGEIVLDELLVDFVVFGEEMLMIVGRLWVAVHIILLWHTKDT